MEEKLGWKFNKLELISKEKLKKEKNKLQFFSENQNKGDMSIFVCNSSFPSNRKSKLRVNRKGEKEVEEFELKANKYIAINGKLRFQMISEENEIEISVFYFEKDFFEFYEKLPKTVKSHIFSFVGLNDLNSLMRSCKTNLQTIKEYDSLIFKRFLTESFGDEICIKKENEKSFFEYFHSLFVSEKSFKRFYLIVNEIIETERVYLNTLTKLNNSLYTLLKKNPKEMVFITVSNCLTVKFFNFFLIFNLNN